MITPAARYPTSGGNFKRFASMPITNARANAAVTVPSSPASWGIKKTIGNGVSSPNAIEHRRRPAEMGERDRPQRAVEERRRQDASSHSVLARERRARHRRSVRRRDLRAENRQDRRRRHEQRRAL